MMIKLFCTEVVDWLAGDGWQVGDFF